MQQPKVLMYGWEFPPFKSGGLGTACHDLTKGLSSFDSKVVFVMPVKPGSKAEFVELVGVDTKEIESMLTAYAQPGDDDVYSWNLFGEVARYARFAGKLAKKFKHDVIHAHDWMTYGAGIIAKKLSGKPLVVHLHATEFDRTANNPDPHIKFLERRGLEEADVIITNSNFSKNNIIKNYDVPAEKIKVVYWGIDQSSPDFELNFKSELSKTHKIVLFLGRLTVQKGCDYFLQAAKKVLELEKNTKFIIVGSGTMMPELVSLAHKLGIDEHVIFTGALKGADVHKAFQMADVFVMPSVSEPFGLVALESMRNKTPLIISKQSGASEVIKNCFKLDFWDVDKMTCDIVSILRYPSLKHELKQNGFKEVLHHDIFKPAKEVLDIYKEVRGDS